MTILISPVGSVSAYLGGRLSVVHSRRGGALLSPGGGTLPATSLQSARDP